MIEIFPNLTELNFFAAEKIVEIAADAIKQKNNFTVALAGGSTPKSLYRLLTTEKYKDQIEWEKVFFFFGDERNVLPDDAESNFRMANENLFAPLQIRDENIFRWRTEIKDAEKTALEMEKAIKSFFNLSGNEFPRFDLILLGMGADGHTASLFPLSKALEEKNKIAVANPVEKLETIRLTLTFPAINNARNIMFLVGGKDKAESLKEVLEGKSQPEKYPAQSAAPTNGSLFWLIEKEAARLLN